MGSWLTRANALTLLRLLAAPALGVAIVQGAALPAAALFVLAVATDFADGYVARRYGEASRTGGTLDHAVDASFVTVGTAALAWTGALPSWLPLLIGVAFLHYALDPLRGKAGALRPSPLGRWNGIAYYVIVGIPVLRDALGLAWPGAGLVLFLGWLLVVSTLLSIADRLRVSRGRRARDWRDAGRADRSPR
jgi:cardiolipin synthase